MLKRKKFIVFTVFVLCMTLIISGCSKNNTAKEQQSTASQTASESSTAATSEVFQLGSEPLDLTFYGNYDWMTVDPWGIDPGTQWIKENMKVNITPIQSGGAAEQKFSTMVASDNYPNIMLLERGSNIEKLRQAGKLFALDDYLDKYPNLKKYAGEATLNMLRSPDGKLYQFPNWYTNKPTGNAGYAINTKIYKSLGSPKLETFDDLYDYLKLVKEKYPKVVPLEVDDKARGLEMMMSGFGVLPNNIYIRAFQDGNQMTDMFKNPVYKQFLTFGSKLFREKLITQDALTQTSDQVKEKLNSGRVAVFAGTDMVEYIRDARIKIRSVDPEADYQAIWPLHAEGVNRDQVFTSAYNTLGWNVNVITTSTKDPEKAFALMDWLTGPDGQRTLWWGPQGTYYDDTTADGAPIMNDKWNSTSEEEKNKQKLGTWDYWGNTGYVDPAKGAINNSMPEEKKDWMTTVLNDVVWKTSADITQFVNLTPDPTSEEGQVIQAVNDLYEQYFGKIIYAKSDAEVGNLLDDASQAASKVGYDKYLKFVTDKWQENVTKMKQ
ncbi:extracellular solute-binding protein [Cohnella endophytica]|uniref:Extracellular solute-binding protein n=1 Tax=Cohnella endophytica TaxID=2419778 RepID=A0A494XZ51_9BACL|nr:extracellular solute-binding protein [Cohnella endophytica]RKP54349.1 extracellular solute-binding protein [Cohnella endophytica]